MPFATRSVMVNAPIEAIWNLLVDKAEHPEKYSPYPLERFKIHETFPNGLRREIKTSAMHLIERVTFDKDAGTVTFEVEDHPIYSGFILEKVTPPEDPGALPILTFTMDLQPRSATSEQQPEAQWFLNAAKPETIYAAVHQVKESLEKNSSPFTTPSMSPNSQLVREMFLAGESMHVENFVKSYSDDALYQFSNFPVVYGPQGIIDASDGFLAKVKYCVHHIQHLWEIDDETLICQMTVTYHRHDGKEYTLPCSDTIRVKNGKVQELRIYMDIGPVLAD
jgi:ketosteroid isomerase-like protein